MLKLMTSMFNPLLVNLSHFGLKMRIIIDFLKGYLPSGKQNLLLEASHQLLFNLFRYF